MINSLPLCGCIKCTSARSDVKVDRRVWPSAGTVMVPGWRYACEKCGNKRCPHHSDHLLACTGSNDSGQKGSVL